VAQAPLPDPRSIVTPDAFQVSRDLLGLPLAAPSRRLVAILVDLLLIAVLSQLGGTALAVTGAIFLFLLARRERTNSTRGGRMLMGCLGVLVLVVAVFAVLAVVALFRGDGIQVVRSGDGVEGSGAASEPGNAMLLAQGVGDVILLTQSTTAQEALDPAQGLVTRGRALGLTEQDLRGILGDVVPQADWRDQVIAAALGPEGTGGAAGEGPGATPGGETNPGADSAEAVDPGADTPGDTPAGAGPADTPPSSTPPEVASRWALLLASGDTLEGNREEWRALRLQVLALSGADSLTTLQERGDRLEERNEQLSTRVGSLRDELEAEREQEEGFFLPFLTGIFEDLGLAFGFGTIYLTVFTAWWGGQTPGKKLLGVRVLRLDGKPIGWWDAFERAGGYAAGFATGLLGFAQVFWDPNRQAIHDRVSSTVVVREGAPRAPGKWAMAVDADPGRGVRYEFERKEES
jgi:hypothetical protein